MWQAHGVGSQFPGANINGNYQRQSHVPSTTPFHQQYVTHHKFQGKLCFHWNCYAVITQKFCTCQDSTAVMACAIFWTIWWLEIVTQQTVISIKFVFFAWNIVSGMGPCIDCERWVNMLPTTKHHSGELRGNETWLGICCEYLWKKSSNTHTNCNKCL